jgi:hypothetical protein
MLAALGGLYLLTVPREGLSRLNHGDLLTLVAAGLYAVHIILVGDYTRRHSVAALSVLQVAACAVLAWVATTGPAATSWQPARFDGRWELAAAVGICAVFATAIAFSTQLWAQQYTSPSHAAIIFYAGAGVCGDHVLPGDRRTAESPFHVRRDFRASRDLDCRIAGPGRGPRVAGTHGRDRVKSRDASLVAEN